MISLTISLFFFSSIKFLYKGEKLSVVRRRLEELREAGLSNDQALLLRLRDTGAGAFNFGRSRYW